jgi:thioredoxin 1
MDEEHVKKFSDKRLLKIIVPVLIVCIIAGIWIAKNLLEKPEANAAANPDFSLVVTDVLDLETLKGYGLPILIEFGSDSCAPCREMAPIIESLNEELQGKAIIKYADVWKYPHLAESYPLSVIPTQLFIGADGKPYNPADPDALSMNLYAEKDTGVHVFTTHEGTLTKDELLTILDEMGMQ